MSIEIQDVAAGGGGFFKPAEHLDTTAILVEVKKLERQRPGNFGPKDAIHANLTVFRTQESLNAGIPDESSQGTIIQGMALTKSLEDLVGKATIVTVAQSKPKAGQKPAWLFMPAPGAVKAQVVEFVTKREAAIKEAVAAAPSFE